MFERKSGKKNNEELDNSLEIHHSGGRANADELIVFGDNEDENDQSSMLNSNLLQMLELKENYGPVSQSRLGDSNNRKSNLKNSPELLASKLMETTTMVTPFKIPTTLSDLPAFLNDNPKDVSPNKTRNASKEGGRGKSGKKQDRMSSKESNSSRQGKKSRRQSKDVGNQGLPLKQTLASTLSKLPNFGESTTKMDLMKPIESFKHPQVKTARELKLIESAVDVQTSKANFGLQGFFHQAKLSVLESPPSFKLNTEKPVRYSEGLPEKKPVIITRQNTEGDASTMPETDFGSDRIISSRGSPNKEELARVSGISGESVQSKRSPLNKTDKNESKSNISQKQKLYKPATLSQLLAKHQHPKN